MDFSKIPEGSPERDIFRKDFVRDVVASLGQGLRAEDVAIQALPCPAPDRGLLLVLMAHDSSLVLAPMDCD